jgi:hypothetical protein
MILDANEYSEQILVNGKQISPRTVLRRAKSGTLPSHTIVHKKKGIYIFEIPEIPNHIRDNFIVKITAKPRP